MAPKTCSNGGCNNPAEFVLQEDLGGVQVPKEVCSSCYMKMMK